MKPESEIVKRIRERKQDKASKKRGRWTKIFAIYGAILSTLLSSYTAYKELRPKSHNLEIFASDIRVNEDIIEYGIAFYNHGDFHEIVGNASSVLGQAVEGESGLVNWEQPHCFKSVSLKPGESTYIWYVTKFNFNEQKQLFSGQKQEFLMRLDFDVLAENGIITERIPVGVLIPYTDVKEWDNKAEYNFAPNRVKVNFETARPRTTLGSYPEDKKFSFSTLCTK